MPDWVPYNGLFIPEKVSLAKKLEQEMQAKANSGKFFSNYSMTTGRSGLGYDKPASTIQFDILKAAREKSLIDKIIIMARVAQVKQIAKRCLAPGKQLGYRVVHESHADSNFSPTADTIKRCKEMEKIIENVNSTIHPNGFVDFAAVVVDQELTYDHKCCVITRDRMGLPIQYHAVDGTTVKPVIQVLMDYQNKYNVNQDRAYRDIYRAHGLDLTNAAYVQVVNGQPVASWTADEMNVNITNPSVEIDKWVYGAGSQLEQSLAATTTWLNAWAYNDGLFNQDSPESLLMLYGDIDPVGLGAFQRQILDQSGSGDYQKIPVIPADESFKAELIKIRELPKDIQFAEFLRIIVQLKCAAYRAHPSIVNFRIDKGSTGGLSIGNNSEEEFMKDAKEEGFYSLAHAQAAWLTRMLIKPRYEDLVMIYEVNVEDEVRRIDLLTKQSTVGMTFNEARRAQGLQGDLVHGDIPNSAIYVQAMQMTSGVPQDEKEAHEAVGEETATGTQTTGTQTTGTHTTDTPKEGTVQKSLTKSEKVLIFEFEE